MGQVRYDRDPRYGTMATYSCRRGYGLMGASLRTCQANGSWSESPPSCRSECVHGKYGLKLAWEGEGGSYRAHCIGIQADGVDKIRASDILMLFKLIDSSECFSDIESVIGSLKILLH